MVTFFGGCLPSKNGRIQSWTLLLSLIFAILAFSPFTTGNETTCKTSASEVSLQIACNFPKNINTTKSSFCVYHFTSKGTSVVLACNWLDDELSCFTEEGFKIPKHVSNSFITEVEGHVYGDFGCDILPRSSKSNIKRCKLPAHKGVAEPRGDSQANTKNISMDAKNNTTVNNADPVNCNHYCPWICSVLILIISLLMLLIFLMKRNNSTEVLNVLWCRRPEHKHVKEKQNKKSEKPDASQNSVEVFQPLNDAIKFRKPETQNGYLTSLVNESEQVSTQPDYIGAIPIRPFFSVSDERQTPDENKPLSPHIPEKAPSHQNGSVKQSSPLNDISVSVQRRTPDEEQPWLPSGPEKFRNDMYSASMHNYVHDDMSSRLHNVCSY